MAYDAQLASRVRELFADGPPVLEKAMFGGLAFLVAGKIAVAASADGGLLVRVGAARAGEILRTTAAQPMEMGGRTMHGWVHVDAGHLSSRRQLAEWIDIGIAAAANA
ncbi:hypothetical protein MTER_13460 [Mycolicibacter terrae]|uniref:TfoX N-terminal domain-containing protein n=1 Tax=Mycolicibacter terrae TaxID=1788 RepID=A0AAD1HW83_9MYCO|nr:TfoX/Sxy family protein [Mycolicibacter terrae]ORW89462.1 RNA methyltransferase [Mycolicibacter terrae]BBX21935.1 hypothetical protein MTER_13460 [Mycolicibacter terrae]SNV82602.1 TfoX N-terminal domain-containing protein [Mycolicibacter terrae]